MRPHLNRQLVLEQSAKAQDGAGGFAESWESLGVIWAEVNARSGVARSRKSLGISRVDYRIIVRAAPVGAQNRPIAGQRFREGARLFRILAVAEADRDGRYLTCFSREESAA